MDTEELERPTGIPLARKVEMAIAEIVALRDEADKWAGKVLCNTELLAELRAYHKVLVILGKLR